jgi:N-acetylneuraminic acid mutarotase
MRKPCEGHTVSVVDRSLYILFGKHEDDHNNCVCPPMQVLDTETMALSSPPTDCEPKEREGHTATVVGQLIFIFGGTWTNDEVRTEYMNDLHVLDVRTLTWSLPVTSGCPPIKREGHTAVAVETRLFIFGGTWVDDEDQSHDLNDLHLLDVETMPMGWSVGVCSGKPPSQREGHTSSVVGAQIVVFGGAGLDVEEGREAAYAMAYDAATRNVLWSTWLHGPPVAIAAE